MKILSNITLIGIDCVDLKRLQLAADISSKEISFGSVKLLTSIKSDDPRVIKISPIHSGKVYSNFIIKELYKYIDTEFALIFQHDGFILNPDAWTDEFLNYDYIGAPWYHLGDLHVGNGGFSLRSKKLITWLANNWQKIKVPIHPEDIFIAKFAKPYIEKEGMKFAPKELAAKFSKEGDERSVMWNGEFGFHGKGYTDISLWLDKNPEYNDRLMHKYNDYTTLMKKYPVFDGTVYTFRFYKNDIKNYIKISRGEKNYEVRLTHGKYEDLSAIKEGNTVVFKRSGVSFEKVPIPAFEKKIKKIESFNSFSDLRQSYPKIIVTFPYKKIKKWKRLFVGFFGDAAYPKEESYTIFWFA